MAVQRQYQCDLCRDSISTNGNGLKGFGVYWVGGRLEERPVNQVEHHICVKCVRAIKRNDFAPIDPH